jgi:heme-degrading monooxygenase HmoA
MTTLVMMYTTTFTFLPGEVDEAFHALDERIAQAARALPGYIGEESWDSATTGQVCNVYYWRDWASVQALMALPEHREAKALQASWLKGYQVVIAEVLRHHGDGRLAHPLTGQ